MAYLLIILFLWVQPDSTLEQELLNKGRELEEAGLYMEALKTWGSAMDRLDSPSLAIGREYIRLTTEQNLRDKYEEASAMYFWGLSAERDQLNFEALQEEFRYLQPLMSEELARELKKDLKVYSASALTKIRSFWEQLDPTPFTAYNERLLEHWERIAYARANFTEDDNTVYGTDDRGVTYVTYGPPDMLWEDQFIVTISMIELACTKLVGCPPISQVWNYTTDPYFEIWSYVRPNKEMQYDMLHLFGDTKLDGFGKVRTVEDYIPDNAFNLGLRYEQVAINEVPDNNFKGLTPGMVLAYIYYDKVKSYHGLLANRFTYFDYEWTNPMSPPAKRDGIREKAATMHMLNREDWAAPDQISTQERDFPTIPVDTWFYRLLDDKGDPVLAVFTESVPGGVLVEDLARNQDMLLNEDGSKVNLNAYELQHGLMIKDPSNNTRAGKHQQVPLIIDQDDQTAPSVSLQILPHETYGKLIANAELYNTEPGTVPEDTTAFDLQLRGRGLTEKEIPDPLMAFNDDLLISDLLIGYDLNAEAEDDVRFPFYVSHERKIPQGKEIVLHFEVYNLSTEESGTANFDVQYSVTPLGRERWFRSPENEVRLALDFQTDADRFAEDLSIQTRLLKPGSYRLKLTVLDLLSGKSKRQSVDFEVTEN